MTECGRDMRSAVFTGSFDPFTNGHLDIVERAAAIFDRLTVAICVNTEKGAGGMFTPEERLRIAEASVRGCRTRTGERVRSEICPSLLAEFIRERGIGVIIRGSRGAAEFEYETVMADVNRAVGGIETVILPARPELSFISSTVARDMIKYGRAEVAMAEEALLTVEEIMARK